MLATKTFDFEIVYESKRSLARVGRIVTPHGVINTPGFVAVGTNGSIKALDNVFLEKLSQELMFCNTYHLLLHPGPEVVQQAGGLHKYIHRTQPIITDSGGFQVFSLMYGGVADELKSKGKKQQSGSVLKITEEGVKFRSYRDGKTILLTPESSVQIQKALGADIIIPLDELPPFHIGKRALLEAFKRTHRWEERSLNTHLANTNNQAMYAVVHGGLEAELRQASAKQLASLPFDGFAIGGSLGKNTDDVKTVLQHTVNELPKPKPRHLLGIGDLPSIEAGVSFGIDTFDSAYPTKNARHGNLLQHEGLMIKIGKSVYKKAFEPVDKHCACYTCQHYTKAYLYHLFKAKEPTFHTLATIHNLACMNDKMAWYRQAILDGKI